MEMLALEPVKITVWCKALSPRYTWVLYLWDDSPNKNWIIGVYNLKNAYSYWSNFYELDIIHFACLLLIRVVL